MTPPINFIPALLFTGLPLVTLSAVTRAQHRPLFGTLVVSFAVGILLLQLTDMNANPTAAGAHVINDWTEFLLQVLVGGHKPIQPGA